MHQPWDLFHSARDLFHLVRPAFFFCSFFVLHIFPHVIPNEREKESACSGAAVFGHAPARTTLVVLRSHEVERFQILVGEHNKELTGGKGQDRGYWRIKRVLE